MIGFASALPLLVEGRVSGVSGYASMALRPLTPQGRIGFFFVVGLVLGGWLWRLCGGVFDSQSSTSLGLGAYALAGFLVGLGTRLGGGCTSGHGICGLGRISRRSFVAVVVFMAFGMLTTCLMRILS